MIAAGTITLGDDDLRVLRNKSGKRRWRKYIPFLKRNSTEQPRQIVEEKKQDVAPWLAKDHDKYQVGLQVEGSDGVGVLHEITGLLSGEHSINIRRLNVESKGDKFIADMIVEVEDLESLQNVMNELKQIPSIDKLVRLS